MKKFLVPLCFLLVSAAYSQDDLLNSLDSTQTDKNGSRKKYGEKS